jgi:hypothetical protein
MALSGVNIPARLVKLLFLNALLRKIVVNCNCYKKHDASKAN